MRARYIFVICMISLIINVVSVYNVLLGFVSLLLMLITFVTTLYVRIVARASKVKEGERSYATRQLASYGSQRMTRTMNRFAVIFGLIVVYLMAAGSLLLQIKKWDHIGLFITRNLNVEHMIGVAQMLSKIGWFIFIISLILVTIHTIRLMKSSTVFSHHKHN